MNGARVLALARRIVRGFRHDPRTLALVVIMPLVVMALIGYLLTGTKEPVPVAVVAAPGSEAFIAALQRQPAVSVRTAPSAEAAIEEVRSGSLVAAIVPSATGGPAVRLIVSGVDPRVEEPVVRAVESALRSSAPGVAPAPAVAIEHLDIAEEATLRSVDVFAPALITFFAFFFTLMLTSVAFLRERSSGTLDRLLASPISKTEILLGYLLGFMGFALLQSLLVLGYAMLVLHVRVAGPLWLVLLVVILLVIGAVNLGITLSFYARNELQVIQFLPLVLMPQVFLGGLFWPVQTLWPPLRYLSQAFPLTHATAALRAVMLAGDGAGDVAGRLGAIAVFAVVMVGFGVTVLRGRRA